MLLVRNFFIVEMKIFFFYCCESSVKIRILMSMFDVNTEKEFLMKQGQNADLMMMEELLDGLGPRYADWKGKDPVPVDGDLLLDSEFKFKRPFRLLPHGVKPKLNDFEMTQLRRLARPVPPHFVLGEYLECFFLMHVKQLSYAKFSCVFY